MPAVLAQRVAPGRFGILARRRCPFDFPAGKGRRHEAGMEQHANGREQHGIHAFGQRAERQAQRATKLAGALAPKQRDAQHLGREKQRGRGTEQQHGPLVVPLRPQRKELILIHEVLRWNQGLYRQQHGGEHQENEPQWGRQIGHDAGGEHHAVRGMQALGQQQPRIDQVALAPAPVTLQFVEQIGRHFLVTARQIVGDPYGPAGTAHQRGFDKIVREDFQVVHPAPWQTSERAMADERGQANDRVVPPVMGFAELPEV